MSLPTLALFVHEIKNELNCQNYKIRQIDSNSFLKDVSSDLTFLICVFANVCIRQKLPISIKKIEEILSEGYIYTIKDIYEIIYRTIKNSKTRMFIKMIETATCVLFLIAFYQFFNGAYPLAYVLAVISSAMLHYSRKLKGSI